MTVLRGVILEMIHLFVDDGSLALALVLWCAAVWFALSVWPSFLAVSGPVLFVGCSVILLVNIIHAARSHVARRAP
jgi:hypothetical protein